MRRTGVAVMLVLLLTAAAFAETMTMSYAEVLSGKTIPLTISYKEIDSNWTQFSYETSKSDFQSQALMMQLTSHGMPPLMLMRFFTKGDIVVCEGEAYLVTYRHENLLPKLLALMMERNGAGDEEAIARLLSLTSETRFNLCLLSTKSALNMLDIGPVNLEMDIEESHHLLEQRYETESIANLKKLTLILLMSVDDNGERIPTFTSNLHLFEKLGVPDVMTVQPASKQLYQVNAGISGMTVATVSEPDTMLAFYEAMPDEDGARHAAFLDGHVEQVDAAKWEVLKREFDLE